MSTDPTPLPAWPRPNRTGATDARARQHYVAFFATEIPDVGVDPAALPVGDPLGAFEVEAYTDAAWIAGWTEGPLAAFLAAEPDVDAEAVRGAQAAMGAWAGTPDERLKALNDLARADLRGNG